MKLDTYPKISIITVSFNSLKTIERTIKSVLNQNYKKTEYIIIDGGSTDGTVDIIKKYSQKLFYWISESDNGIYDAMNKGLKKATGEIIGIINSDDWYEIDALNNIAEAFIKNNDVDVIHGILKVYNSNEFVYMYAQPANFLEKTMIEHPTCFIRKSVYNKVGEYDMKYKIAADYDLLIRIKRDGYKFMLLDKVIANFALSGISSDNFKSTIEDIDIKSKYGIISSRMKRVAIIRRFILWQIKKLKQKLLKK